MKALGQGRAWNIPEQKGSLWALGIENDGEVVRQNTEVHQGLAAAQPH